MNKIVKCTHASFTKIKKVAGVEVPGSRVVTSNNKVAVFNANKALETLVSRMRMISLRKHAHTK